MTEVMKNWEQQNTALLQWKPEVKWVGVMRKWQAGRWVDEATPTWGVGLLW